MSPAVEEFLQKFEAMAPASDWIVRHGDLRDALTLDCPLTFVGGSGQPPVLSGPMLGMGMNDRHEIIRAADGRPGCNRKIRRRLLAACGLESR